MALSATPEEKAALKAYMNSLSVKDKTRLYAKYALDSATETALQVGTHAISKTVCKSKQIIHPEAAESVYPKLLEKKSDFTLIEVDGVWKLAEETTASCAIKGLALIPEAAIVGEGKATGVATIGSLDLSLFKSTNFLKHHSLEHVNALAQGNSPEVIKNVVQILESQTTL